ncbi:hypothetical protein VOLCADRAFT_104251 [Volvox carteri f. nagariensis]|uniref:N-alpha-acetyltransferase 60 n=1 Tax=Volvox carteri f. nagariensis TaxID=3068 RepID=D8TSC6_VOLCA|nr:uncharacterized protein VOLCADRAFT_104251 [Volvox carteri f. nagariensis]EFJ49800.1 hypothetical protein VOLCADRAFT_104251 [Volvox carteri f. nagariensis]|eukprot:XP_002949307.1 hypothetical protein VOLCADRAFT_104251 [Volvox carteri f. nagariensis]
MFACSSQLAVLSDLQAIHRELFPIDYEEVFFRKAVAGEDRALRLPDYTPDRQVMGLNPRCLDGECAVYVLTLGVVPACRQCGIARSLLGLVHQHASRLRCRAIFLHVISYNDAAMRLYSTSGYQPMARLPNFYHLITGRQPNPDQSWYDAFLYAHFIPQCGPEPSPAMQWAGGVLGAAVAPLRSMLGSFNGCMPMWFCRQQPPLPPSTAAGTVCAGVTAEQFLKWDHQQQQKQRHLQAGHQQQQQQWCTRAELRQNGAVSSQHLGSNGQQYGTGTSGGTHSRTGEHSRAAGLRNGHAVWLETKMPYPFDEVRDGRSWKEHSDL